MNPKANYTKTMHGRNIIKILKAVNLLSRHRGTTVAELGEELGISRRSVYRLFETLEDLGIPRYEDDVPGEREKRHKLEENYLKRASGLRFPDMRLSAQELMVLYLLLSSDRVFTGTVVESVLHSIREKLAAIMPSSFLSAAQSDRLESLFAAGTLHPKSYIGQDEVIETVLDAVAERRSCTVAYQALSTGATKSYEIYPLRLFQHDGGLYAFVLIPDHSTLRILAVDRIKTLEIHESTYPEPQDFNPDEILSQSFDLTLDDPLSLTVLFTQEAARRVRNRRWSSVQTFSDNPDGSLTLTMSTSGSEDVVRWVLSFAGEAEILEPESLRLRAQEAAERIVTRHSSPD